MLESEAIFYRATQVKRLSFKGTPIRPNGRVGRISSVLH